MFESLDPLRHLTGDRDNGREPPKDPDTQGPKSAERGSRRKPGAEGPRAGGGLRLRRHEADATEAHVAHLGLGTALVELTEVNPPRRLVHRRERPSFGAGAIRSDIRTP